MNERDKTLQSLFGDARLQPTKHFQKTLQAQLRTPRQHLHCALRRVMYASLVTAALALAFGITRLQQPAPTMPTGKPGQLHITARPTTVLVSDLLATILNPDSSQLPNKNITFWKLESKESYGPAAKACLQDPSQPTQPITTLIYDDHHTTAVHQTYGGNSHYSDDPMVSAVNLNQYLGLNNVTVGQWTGGAVLSDASGKPIAPNVSLSYKTTGTYDIYMRYGPSPGAKEYVASCTPLIYHISIDAASGIYTSFAAYRGSIAPENLDVQYDNTVYTQAAPSFASVESQFTANGFDINRANLATDENGEGMVNNPRAGFSFAYHETLLGKVSEQDIEGAHGAVVAYQYHFSKAPKLLMLVRTPAATDQYPKTMTDFETYASANALTLGRRWGGSTDSATLGQITISGNLATGAKLRAYFERTGSPYVPSEFVKDDFDDLPLQQPSAWVKQLAGRNPNGNQMLLKASDPIEELQIQVYKPGVAAPAAM